MIRRIRSTRAARRQGTRAGPLSRLLAMAIDVGLAWAIFIVGVAAAGLIWDFLHTGDVRIANPGPVVTAIATGGVFVVLLTLGWSTTGRSIGKQVLGLRVVTDDAAPLGLRRSFLRALGYLVFPIGGVWIVWSRRSASVQDLVLHTVVVHDWIPAASPLQAPRPQAVTGP